MIVGTRAQVLHGTADRTAGGLEKENLMLSKDGRIVSKAARAAALKRMKREKGKHLTKVFRPAKKGFKLQPRKGTKEYKERMKKM